MSGTQFDQRLYGWRLVQTRVDDTLPALALRELGDASLWQQLAWINDLVWPFLTDDPTAAGPGVILAGGTILVPATTQPPVTSGGDTDVFKTDLALQAGRLTAVQGDFGTVSGADNLGAALVHRLATEQRELLRHPEYGTRLRQLIGMKNTATAALLGQRYAKTAVEADPRIDSVKAATVTITGDQLAVAVVADTVLGMPITISAKASS